MWVWLRHSLDGAEFVDKASVAAYTGNRMRVSGRFRRYQTMPRKWFRFPARRQRSRTDSQVRNARY